MPAIKSSSTALASGTFAQQTVQCLAGVGPRLAERLQRLGISTLQDLFFHLPYRYQDRTHITPIHMLRMGDHAVIEGTILEAKIHRTRRTSLLVTVVDEFGQMILRFFYFNAAQQEALQIAGQKIRCYGEVRRGPRSFEMIHPEYQILGTHASPEVEENLTPVYPTTEGLNQGVLRKLIKQAFHLLKQDQTLPDLLPPFILEQEYFPPLIEALHYLHHPPSDAPIEELLSGTQSAQRRLIFEELLAHQLSLRQVRQQVQLHHSFALRETQGKLPKFIENLPFQLTSAQRRVLKEVSTDLQQDYPMLRLVQGDVGSGKTVIAACALLQAVENNMQAALMAPTELLAEQHYENFKRWFTPLGIEVVRLSGSMKTAEKKAVLEKLSQGQVSVAIGTHALFQEDVIFQKLAVVVIDEQHRFGVHQRLQLRQKGVKENHVPHQLIMTATPIPRTLAMTAYADLDCSIIDELPPGRTPVKTVLVSLQRRQEVIERVEEICKAGRQVYWVCTLIEESEALQCQAAEVSFAVLKEALPHLRLALVHGRVKTSEREEIMQAFKKGQIHLLVATTVIEVGVDVPNASLMVIENAERLGLSQLHQLRGRVGRGSYESFCVLLFQSPLSQIARQRLDIMRQHQSGFVISQHDLELRGPGEFLGTRQTGLLNFKLADLQRDQDLLPSVQTTAQKLLNDYPHLAELLMQRWLKRGMQYGDV
jgi:ATP-dependent DNA helicase RecG